LCVVLYHKVGQFILSRSEVFGINVHANCRHALKRFAIQAKNLESGKPGPFFGPELVIEVKMSLSVIAMQLSCSVNNGQGIVKVNAILVFNFFDVAKADVGFESFGLFDDKLKLFALHLSVCIRKGILMG
jgi:hypothetical protein